MKRLTLTIISIMIALAGTEAQTVMLSQGEARRMALEQSEDIKTQTNKLEQAKLDRQIAFTGYLPKLDASATGAYVGPDIDMFMGSRLAMRGVYMAGITVTQPIYAGGKILAGNRMAKIGSEIADQQLRLTRMDVLADTDNAYWSLVAVRQKVTMLRSLKALVDTLYNQTAVAVSAGMATDNDLLKISSRRSEIDYNLHKAANGADLCRLSLCYATGLDPEAEVIPTDTIIDVTMPETGISDASLRPEINMLEKQVELNKQQVKSSRADMLPTIGLMGGYTYFGNIKMKGAISQEFKDGIGLAMLSVNIPIFHWGENIKKVKKAKLDLLNSELTLQKNTDLISVEIRQAIQNLNDGFTMVAVARTAMDEADENLRVTRARYATSMATVSDMLDAQSQWQQSYSNLIEAQTQYKIYETAYLKATGRLE